MTLTEFKDWSLAESQVAKYDDGKYPGQCVSLINQYCYRVLSVPASSWGHAYAWANDNNPNRQYFDKVGSAEAGDVIVYGTDFTPLYGHIGIYLGNGQLLDQNGHKPLHVAIGAIYNGYAAILRHKGGVPPEVNMPSLATKDQVVSLFDTYTGRAATQDDINAWTGQPLEGLLDALRTGQEAVTYQKKVDDALAGGSNGQYEKVTDLYRKI